MEVKLVDIRKKLKDLYFCEYDYSSPREVSQRYAVSENTVFFVRVLLDTLPNDVSVDELLFTIQLLIKDIESGKCGFHHSPEVEENFETVSERIKYSDDLPVVLSFIPRVVDEISGTKFSLEFSKRFKEDVLGIYNIEEAKGDYGYIEVEEDFIDISNKDKAEVLAGLYNNSQPIGMGMVNYDPTPMTTEVARKILEKKQDFDYLLGRPLKIYLGENVINVRGYNYDNGKKLAQKVISGCRNINEIGKNKLKKFSDMFTEQAKKEIEDEIKKKNKERQEKQTIEQETDNQNNDNRNLDYLRVDTSILPPARRLIEESGYDITDETLEFIKNVENQAYQEEMKLMQDAESIDDVSYIYNHYVEELTIARNKDWYIIYGNDGDSIEIADIASLPDRDKKASREEMHNYITRVINQKAHEEGKYVTLNAKEDTSYKMILRMVNNGEYEIIEDTLNRWNDENEDIIMHKLVLQPIIQRGRDEIE